MTLNKIGEFGLIEQMRSKIQQRSKKIKIGLGDDCAVIATPDCDLLTTADMLIENVHFNLKYFSPKKLGEKAVAVNLSDIASMGGNALYILISLGLPDSTAVDFIEKLYAGFEKMAKKYKCTIIGGDISKSTKDLIISINVIGEIKKDRFVTRSGAKNKDKIFVTGHLGDASAGLDILKRNKNMKNKLVEKHLSPKPRLKEGQILAKEIGVSAMIDLSDGLASDLKRICEESRCGAKIYLDKIPLSNDLKNMRKPKSKNIFNYPLFGGEDYELLFTINEKKVEKLKKLLSKMKVSITNIGEIVNKKRGITLVSSDGRERTLLKRGYDHFKKY